MSWAIGWQSFGANIERLYIFCLHKAGSRVRVSYGKPCMALKSKGMLEVSFTETRLTSVADMLSNGSHLCGSA